MTLRDKTAIVGIGATPYYKRGESLPQTELELAGQAILGALDDAGLTGGERDMTEHQRGTYPAPMRDPYADAITRPFWDAALEGRLTAPAARAAGRSC
jgi:hypothetical protein